jgi:hypothetical protein
MNYLVLSGNTVANIIVADSLEIAETVTGSKCMLAPEGKHWLVGDIIEINE